MYTNEKYNNLLQNYRLEMIKNAALNKMYSDVVVEHSLEIQALNKHLSELTKKLSTVKSIA